MFDTNKFLNSFDAAPIYRSPIEKPDDLRKEIKKAIKCGGGDLPAFVKMKVKGNRHIQIYVVKKFSGFYMHILPLSYALKEGFSNLLSFEQLSDEMRGTTGVSRLFVELLNIEQSYLGFYSCKHIHKQAIISPLTKSDFELLFLNLPKELNTLQSTVE